MQTYPNIKVHIRHSIVAKLMANLVSVEANLVCCPSQIASGDDKS